MRKTLYALYGLISEGKKRGAGIIAVIIFLLMAFAGMIPQSADAAAVVSLISEANTTTTVQLNSPPDSIADFYVFNGSVRKSGGTNSFSDVSTDGMISSLTYSPVSVAWTQGTPIASSSGWSDYDAAELGQFYDATYAQFTLTMPAASGTLEFWLRPNGDTGDIFYDVTVGGVTNSYEDTSGDDDLQHFTYSISGASVGEEITIKVHNVSGSNSLYNVGFMAAQLAASTTPPCTSTTSSTTTTSITPTTSTTTSSTTTSSTTTSSTTTTVPLPEPPAAPSDMKADAVSKTEIRLSWTDNSDDETGFKIYRGDELITTTAANATSYGDTGLACGTGYDYQVIATNDAGDSSGTSASGNTNACNELPYVAEEIEDQYAACGEEFSFTVPDGIFVDPDGDVLKYWSFQQDHPEWMSFDQAAKTFYGTPPESGTFEVTLTATDPEFLGAQTIFKVIVSNCPPYGADEISDQQATYDEYFEFTVPDGTFADPEDENLTYSIPPDISLPDWMSFDSETGTFSGTPVEYRGAQLNLGLMAADPFGNVSEPLYFTLTVPAVNLAPYVAKEIEDQYAVCGEEFSFTVPDGIFVDPEEEVLKYWSFRWLHPDWMSFDQASKTFRGTPLSESGTFDVTVAATDPMYKGAATTFEVIVSNCAPYAAGEISNQHATCDEYFEFTVPDGTFADADDESLTYWIPPDISLPDWMSFDSGTGTFSGTPVEYRGAELNMGVMAADPFGHVSEPLYFTLTVPAVNLAPYVAGEILPRYAVCGEEFSFTVPDGIFVDPEGGALKYWSFRTPIPQLPDWMSLDQNAKTFYGTPPESGTFDVTVTATDPRWAGVQTIFKVIVSDDDVPAYVAIKILTRQAVYGQAFSFTIPHGTFSDPDGETFTYSVPGDITLPDWMSFDSETGTFSGTPYEWGTWRVGVQAETPSGDTLSAYFDVNVAEVNLGPEVAAEIPDRKTACNEEFSFTIPDNTFSDPNGDELKYQSFADQHPDWMSFDPATRKFTGTPTEAGTFEVTLTASDPNWKSVSITFSVIVESRVSVEVSDADLEKGEAKVSVGFDTMEEGSSPEDSEETDPEIRDSKKSEIPGEESPPDDGYEPPVEPEITEPPDIDPWLLYWLHDMDTVEPSTWFPLVPLTWFGPRILFKGDYLVLRPYGLFKGTDDHIRLMMMMRGITRPNTTSVIEMVFESPVSSVSTLTADYSGDTTFTAYGTDGAVLESISLQGLPAQEYVIEDVGPIQKAEIRSTGAAVGNISYITEISPGDINFDGKTGLEDLILMMRVLTDSDISQRIYKELAIDGRITLSEAIRVLQSLAGQ